jgi:glycosyltransferase involved in cell wall biosynthesis
MTETAQAEPLSERRLRIVHCFRNPIGGLFRHVRDLCHAQSAAGHSVGIICDSTTGGAFEDALFAELAPSLALGLTRVPMHRQIALSDFAAARRVYKAAKPLAPDILHGHGAKGGAYARLGGTLLRRAGHPVARIYTPHGGSMHYDPHRLKYRVYFRAERMLGWMTDAFIFVSRYEANSYAAKVHRPRPLAEIIPNGLRPEEFDLVVPNADARDFLYVGMLRDLKGPDVFIRALAALRRDGSNVTAHIYGAGDDADSYHALVVELGLGEAVAFHEPTPARTAFATGRVLVVPSRAESMPYIVLEAAAAGVPMIATAVGGVPEIFGSHADRLVPPGDAEVLAAAMATALAAPEKLAEETKALRDTVRTVHTVAVMAASVESVYRRALANSAKWPSSAAAA